MKKFIALLLALVMALSLVACGEKTPDENGGNDTPDAKDYSGYTIRIYSNSNSTERTTWLQRVSFRPNRMSPSLFSLAAWMAAVSPEMTLLSSMDTVKPASLAALTSQVVRSVELELE